MIIRNLTLPRLAMIAATRGILGMGAGMLLSPRMRSKSRKAVGLGLLAVGVISTLPLAMSVLKGLGETAAALNPERLPEPAPEPVPAHV